MDDLVLKVGLLIIAGVVYWVYKSAYKKGKKDSLQLSAEALADLKKKDEKREKIKSEREALIRSGNIDPAMASKLLQTWPDEDRADPKT